jgi:hypothetical protein
MMRTAARWCGIVLLSCATQVAWAADAEDSDYFGLLRTRDITPFGFLRLDMRPTHARIAPEGSWGVETELAYQNTWALSPNVENYLSTLSGRRDLGPADADAIRALPGENYLVDLELALLDVTFHYKFSSQWAAYLVLSGSWYGGGFLDSTIESFHAATTSITSWTSRGRRRLHSSCRMTVACSIRRSACATRASVSARTGK